ncbi:kinase-like domain-containing protein [Podospora aff. communis PSN243]|uniref:Kinase-like domain-containing protein n=1 Tax=Podospora aff. communis PSN243 TaxID=3040156 RepID=A0AAV9GGZ8_9PEZI|nr:kinase-like domain-containing protein [Podospora aff. communis PSN243]
MRSPYFRLEDKPFVLDKRVSLPWVPCEQPKKKEHSSGGFSNVWKIKIHQDHHDMETNNGHFALKTLKKTEDREYFIKEFNAHRRITCHHTHIAMLSTAFSHGDTHCLVFPWADGGDLRDLLKINPSQIGSWCTADWLWDSCRGISEGLLHMHHPQTQSGGNDSEWKEDGTGNRNKMTSVPQLHTDIHPANILCFSDTTARTNEEGDGNNSNGEARGPYTLKLADLGLAQAFSKSGRVLVSDIGDRFTYRPPEKDLEDEFTTEKWDIWSLGCLFLELVTWFLTGPKALDTFSETRDAEADHPRAPGCNANTSEDTFFRIGIRNRVISRLSLADIRKTAKVKRCVTAHIREMKEKTKETPHLHDLLKHIGDRMLVIDSAERASTAEVVSFFSGDRVTSEDNNTK